jgi:hypothetical protein
MFRFTFRDLLWLMMVTGIVNRIASQEPGPSLKELLRQDPDKRLESPAAAIRYYLSFHGQPPADIPQPIAVISWFRDDGRTALRYRVIENGSSEDVRDVFNRAVQAWHQKVLRRTDLKQLSQLLPTLPASTAEPPIERTVHVSFRSGVEWRTETYDAAKLPDEFEKVLLIIGERFETKGRHQNSK